jgi:hypothetical protein
MYRYVYLYLYAADDYTKGTDTMDVWFDSGTAYIYIYMCIYICIYIVCKYARVQIYCVQSPRICGSTQVTFNAQSLRV